MIDRLTNTNGVSQWLGERVVFSRGEPMTKTPEMKRLQFNFERTPLAHASSSINPIPNPKQNSDSSQGRATWYPYYAGYCPRFVEGMLNRFHFDLGSKVLDPWNGAGTTSQVAHDLGFESLGFDLNPAMVIVSKARLLDRAELDSIVKRLPEIIRRILACRRLLVLDADPLGAWLKAEAITAVRHAEWVIRLQYEMVSDRASSPSTVAEFSSEPAFFFTAIFRTLRHILRGFRASNPMWMKVARDPESRLNFSKSYFVDLLKTAVSCMVEEYRRETPLTGEADSKRVARLEVASSLDLPLADGEADLVIASPPYCTRIDYAVATRVELAVLGNDLADGHNRLRDRMIGTSTIRDEEHHAREEWGEKCNRFLQTLANHPSKASRTYYLKTHSQYFSDLHRSLKELDRCLRPGAHCVLVVQDSYYKDQHNDLPSIVEEMGEGFGWRVVDQAIFNVSRSMAGLNGRSRRFRPSPQASECVLCFRVTHKGR